jgi:hypothetical protein
VHCNPTHAPRAPLRAGGGAQPGYLAFGSLACLGAACVALLLLLGPCAPLLLPSSWHAGPAEGQVCGAGGSAAAGAPTPALQPQGPAAAGSAGRRAPSNRPPRSKLGGGGADTDLQQALLQPGSVGGSAERARSGGSERRRKHGSLPQQQSLGRSLALLGASSSSCEGGGPGGSGPGAGSREVDVLLGASSEDQHSSCSFAGTYGEHYEMSPEGDVLMPLPASHRLAALSAGGLLERGAGTMWAAAAAAAAAGVQQGGDGDGQQEAVWQQEGEAQAQAMQGAGLLLRHPLMIHLPAGPLLPPGAVQPAGAAEGPPAASPSSWTLLLTPPGGQPSPDPDRATLPPLPPSSMGASGGAPATRQQAAALPQPATPPAEAAPLVPPPVAPRPAAAVGAAEQASPGGQPAPGASTATAAGGLHALVAVTALQQQGPSSSLPHASPSTRAVAAELQQAPGGPVSITRHHPHSAGSAGSPGAQAAGTGEAAGSSDSPGGSEPAAAAADAEASELDKLCAAAAAALSAASAPLPAHGSLGFLSPGSPGAGASGQLPPLSRSGSMRGSAGQLPWLDPAVPQQPQVAGGAEPAVAGDGAAAAAAAAAAAGQAGAGRAPLQRQRSGGLSQLMGSLPRVSPQGGSPVGRAEGHMHEFSDLQQLLQRL